LLALSRPRALPTLLKKTSQSMEIGKSLAARLVQESDQDSGSGQGITVSTVAIRHFDSVV
jgi:hypothetical protein